MPVFMWDSQLHSNLSSHLRYFGLLGILSLSGLAAQAQLDTEIEQADGIAEHSYKLGIELEELGRFTDAFEAYERAVQEDPSHAQALNKLGVIYETQGNKAEAEYYYREAFIQNPAFHLARLNLARFLKKSNRQPAAAKLLQATLELDAGYFEARMELSEILVDQKLHRLAIALLQDGLLIHNDEPHLNLQLGKVHVMAGEPDKSISFLEAAANGKEENHVSSLDFKSIKVEANWIPTLMYDAGKNQEKTDYYLQKVLEIDPSNENARLFAAKKAFASLREEEARKHLEILLNLPLEDQPDPNELIRVLPFPQGAMILADIYRRSRRADVGKTILEQSLAVSKDSGNRIWTMQIQMELNRYK